MSKLLKAGMFGALAVALVLGSMAGAQAAEITGPVRPGGTSAVSGPPVADTLTTPPRSRNSTRLPSGDQRGCDWTCVVSSVSAMPRPPATGRTYTRIRDDVPLA